MIHLVIGATAMGSLSLNFSGEGHQVIGFPIDFSIGSIKNIHKNSSINHHFSWLKSTFSTVPWDYGEEQQGYEEALQKLLSIKNDEQITIWTCENATEQIGIRICCYLLREKQVDISFVNTFKAMHDFTKGKNYRMDIRHSGECSAEKLQHFYENSILPISEEVRRQYEKDGENMLNSTSLLRLWEQGKIVEVTESREDSFILDCAKRIQFESQKDYINAIKVIGIVLGESVHTLSDAWIEYRVRALIESGELVYKGDLFSIGSYEIKVV